MVGGRFWKETNGGVKFTLVAFLFLLTFMATSYFFDRRFDVSSFMWLPKEARVIEYRNSPTGECYVRYSLSKRDNTEANYKEIWARNTNISPAKYDPSMLSGGDKGFWYTLSRNDQTGVCSYQVVKAMPATMAPPRGSGPYLAPATPAKRVAPSVKGP